VEGSGSDEVTSHRSRTFPPLVSIVLPCYREPVPILQRTLDSLLAQTYPNIEIVVVVDDPGNAAILAHLEQQASEEPRIRVVVNSHNLGAWGSYDRGAQEAKGEIIAISHGDLTLTFVSFAGVLLMLWLLGMTLPYVAPIMN